MRRCKALLAAALAALALGLGLTGCRRTQQYSASWFDVFDTVVTVTGYAASQAQWDAQMDALHADLLRSHQLYDIYHHYDGMVNLYDVNATAAGEPVAVDEELFTFLQFAAQMYGTTEGACNVAAGAVLALWHDAREADTPAPPETAALQAAAAHCDIADLVLDESARTVYFTDPDLRLDVGAIAKGYAVEQAALAAEARGLTSAVINAGGNVRAIGTKPGGERWSAGVENPWQTSGPMVAAVELEPGESLVISGNYQRYFEYEGVRYHHLIDLTTLQPANYVSAVAVRCTLGSGVADALSTGLFCMPVAQGQALADATPGVEALWMGADESCTETAGFA